MAGERQKAAVLDSMAEGDWYYSNVLSGSQQWTADTERQIKAWGSATDKKILVYARIRFQAYDLSGSTQPYRWFLVKTTGVGTPSISTEDEMYGFMKENKIFARGNALAVASGGSMPPVIKLSKFNVELEPGEYLQFVIIPMATTAGATMVEWRECEDKTVTLGV